LGYLIHDLRWGFISETRCTHALGKLTEHPAFRLGRGAGAAVCGSHSWLQQLDATLYVGVSARLLRKDGAWQHNVSPAPNLSHERVLDH
jgi:hypothetical protein